MVKFCLVSVPDPKPTPAWIAFSIARGKRYTCWMRSGNETKFYHKWHAQYLLLFIYELLNN